MAFERNKKLVEGLTTMLTAPQPHYKVCEKCGREFPVNSDDSELTKCLICQVTDDMRLPDYTLINMNIINLWKMKRFDKEKGIDPLLCAVAEGIFVLPDDVVNRDDKTIITRKKNTLANDDIEKYLKRTIKKANEHYDAVVIIRFGIKDDFSVFKVCLSNRLVNKLKKYDLLFIKKFIISLVVKYHVNKTKKKKNNG